MSLVPNLPLSLEELSDYYKIAIRECDFLEPILRKGLAYIEFRYKPSPLVSVQFNSYEAYYVAFLSHLKWRLSSLCVPDYFGFADSEAVQNLRAHEYQHSGVGHPIGEEEINPMLSSIGFVRTQLIEILEQIERDMLKSIFMCHSSSDKAGVRDLAELLTRRGAKVWLDEAEILVGDSIMDQIQTGIEESDYLGVVLSPRSVESIWVKKEVEAALTQEIEMGKVKVVPILLEPCDIPLFLRSKKYADYSADEVRENGLEDIIKRLSQG
ncbi:toll/interleukin-1 receptor domain-containing protein [Maricaulis sp.]|uniref:toll/interleukin-1 receptor domain-containing protein n=1 Tax=Maricaulis sp. TaxID=1486257 RepID=UPI0025C4550D|nr:toll/interleukin-1 receptor domain-containing protein [Maricaulis sp.]